MLSFSIINYSKPNTTLSTKHFEVQHLLDINNQPMNLNNGEMFNATMHSGSHSHSFE